MCIGVLGAGGSDLDDADNLDMTSPDSQLMSGDPPSPASIPGEQTDRHTEEPKTPNTTLVCTV